MIIKSGMKIINSHGLPTKFGTVGGCVQSLNQENLLITCFHCVFDSDPLFGGWDTQKPAKWNRVSVSENGTIFSEVGTIVKTLRNDQIDIALIKLDGEHSFNPMIPGGIGKPLAARPFVASEKDLTPVKKFGAASSTGFGIYSGTRPQVGVDFEFDNGKTHYFNFLYQFNASSFNCLAIPGDSGSLVLDSNNHVLGVVSVVNQSSYTTYVIPSVVIEFQMDIKF